MRRRHERIFVHDRPCGGGRCPLLSSLSSRRRAYLGARRRRHSRPHTHLHGCHIRKYHIRKCLVLGLALSECPT